MNVVDQDPESESEEEEPEPEPVAQPAETDLTTLLAGISNCQESINKATNLLNKPMLPSHDIGHTLKLRIRAQVPELINSIETSISIDIFGTLLI